MKFKWTDIKNKKIDGIYWVIDHNTILDYAYFGEQFDINLDGINLQIGSVIIQ